MRYGLRMLVELAVNYGKSPVLLKNIAKCEHISKKYLEQIVITLKAAGIISAIRGARGGYYLLKPPDKILLKEIFMVLEGSFTPIDCIDHPAICGLQKDCPTKPLWSELSQAIEKVFDKKTLADLL
jgi:Rrf2 family protein